MKILIIKFSVIISALFIGGSCFLQSSKTPFVPPAEINISLPKWTGKHGVGRQMIKLVDENRGEPRSPDTKREIFLWIYYPTAPGNQTANEAVLSENWASAYRGLLEKRIGAPSANAILALKTAAQTDAEIVGSPQNFPVLIFAPGLNWIPIDYSATLEDLASHGFIVAGIAAPPVSPVVSLINHHQIENLSGDETYKLVKEDFLFVRKELENLNKDANLKNLKIKGKLDLSKIGAFGHSMGGAAAVWASAEDLEMKASANLDGDFAGGAAEISPAKPMLYITTEPPQVSGAPPEKWSEDRSETRRNGVWEKIKSNSPFAVRVLVPKMFHSNFQDTSLLPPASMPEDLRKNRYGTIEGLRGVNLTKELLLKFFDAQLNSAPVDDLFSVGKIYPEILFEKTVK